MAYRIGKVSRVVGLTTQTLREYENLGLLEAEKDAESGYRYFDAPMICKSVAIRYLRNLGFTLGETQELLNEKTMSYERYCGYFGSVLVRQREELEYRQMVCEMAREQAETVERLHETVGRCFTAENVKFYCLDYLKNGELILQREEETRVLSQWIERALFTCNYSPMPLTCLSKPSGAPLDMGLAVKETWAKRLGLRLEGPVYARTAPLCVCARIRHSNLALPTPEELSCVGEYMEQNKLEMSGGPFHIGDCTVWEDGAERSYSMVYIPARLMGDEKREYFNSGASVLQ